MTSSEACVQGEVLKKYLHGGGDHQNVSKSFSVTISVMRNPGVLGGCKWWPPQSLRVAQAVSTHRSWLLAGCLQHHQGTCSWPHSALRATEARWVIIGK